MNGKIERLNAEYEAAKAQGDAHAANVAWKRLQAAYDDILADADRTPLPPRE